MKNSLSRLLAVAGIAIAGLLPTMTVAGDNSGIVVIEQQHRASPYGRYDSNRRLQVYGSGSGFRYRERRYAPLRVPVYPGYGRRRYHHFSPQRHSRFAPPSAAPYAPQFGARSHHRWHHRRDRGFDRHGSRRHYRHDGRHRGRYEHNYGNNRFGHSPSQRAMRPAQRAIEPAQRAIGR